jgi:hypothetical protein
MIIKDKELKKQHDAIPDADENGEPIYKIDADSSEEPSEKPADIPLFMKDTTDAPHGNKQDLKDSGEE